MFPHHLFFKWLSYNQMKKDDAHKLQSLEDKEVLSEYFYQREFTFTLASDIYCRYLSFKTADDFKKALVDRCPHKMDIGAVYNVSPANKLQQDKKAFYPIERELVFDIDMDAYDDIRQCCSGAKVCQKCWALPCLAAQVITKIMRADFDFTNLLWVFSGRRGVHAWVCDPEARTMGNDMRAAIANYIGLGLGNEKADRLRLQAPLHPHLVRAVNDLKPHFRTVVIREQDVLSDPAHEARMMQFLPAEVRPELQRRWREAEGGDAKWEIWEAVYADCRSKAVSKNRN